MATFVQNNPQHVPSQAASDDAVEQLLGLVEGCYDDLGLSEAERDARYANLAESLNSKDAALATA